MLCFGRLWTLVCLSLSSLGVRGEVSWAAASCCSYTQDRHCPSSSLHGVLGRNQTTRRHHADNPLAAVSECRPLLWRELAKSVPGRSNKDCRRRWWNSLADGTAKGPWSEEEDERLIEAVRIHGPTWSRVARVVKSRNPDQCSSHWSQVLDPGINYCDWTAEEVPTLCPTSSGSLQCI